MGRNKGEQSHTKSKPSSSSLAASLLQSGVPNLSLGGFGGYVGNVPLDTVAAEHQGGQDENSDKDEVSHDELHQHFKRFSKKDDVTKLKALNALKELFPKLRAKDVPLILPTWVAGYRKLSTDSSRQVREGAHKAMEVLAVAVGRNLALYLKSLIGSWWLGQFDSSSEVASAARSAFQASFQSAAKQKEVLVFGHADILHLIDENLKLTPQTVADKALPADEADQKYQQVISSSLNALAALLESLLGQPDNLAASTTSAIKEKAILLCESHQWFKVFLKSKLAPIRSTTYLLLRVLTQQLPHHLALPSILPRIAPAVLATLGETDPQCLRPMWELILLFTQQFPEVWSMPSINFQKAVFPKLRLLLQNACYGSASDSYPCLLPFLSFLTESSAMAATEEFLSEFLLNIWSGLFSPSSSDPRDRKHIYAAMRECALFCVKFLGKQSCGATWTNSKVLVESVLLTGVWNDSLSGHCPPAIADSVWREELCDFMAQLLHLLVHRTVLSAEVDCDDWMAPVLSSWAHWSCQTVVKEMESDRNSPACEGAVTLWVSQLLPAVKTTIGNSSPAVLLYFEEWMVVPLVEELYPQVPHLKPYLPAKLLSTAVEQFGTGVFRNAATSQSTMAEFFCLSILPWSLKAFSEEDGTVGSAFSPLAEFLPLLLGRFLSEHFEEWVWDKLMDGWTELPVSRARSALLADTLGTLVQLSQVDEDEWSRRWKSCRKLDSFVVDMVAGKQSQHVDRHLLRVAMGVHSASRLHSPRFISEQAMDNVLGTILLKLQCVLSLFDSKWATDSLALLLPGSSSQGKEPCEAADVEQATEMLAAMEGCFWKPQRESLASLATSILGVLYLILWSADSHGVLKAHADYFSGSSEDSEEEVEEDLSASRYNDGAFFSTLSPQLLHSLGEFAKRAKAICYSGSTADEDRGSNDCSLNKNLLITFLGASIHQAVAYLTTGDGTVPRIVAVSPYQIGSWLFECMRAVAGSPAERQLLVDLALGCQEGQGAADWAKWSQDNFNPSSFMEPSNIDHVQNVWFASAFLTISSQSEAAIAEILNGGEPALRLQSKPSNGLEAAAAALEDVDFGFSFGEAATAVESGAWDVHHHPKSRIWLMLEVLCSSDWMAMDPTVDGRCAALHLEPDIVHSAATALLTHGQAGSHGGVWASSLLKDLVVLCISRCRVDSGAHTGGTYLRLLSKVLTVLFGEQGGWGPREAVWLIQHCLEEEESAPAVAMDVQVAIAEHVMAMPAIRAAVAPLPEDQGSSNGPYLEYINDFVLLKIHKCLQMRPIAVCSDSSQESLDSLNAMSMALACVPAPTPASPAASIPLAQSLSILELLRYQSSRAAVAAMAAKAAEERKRDASTPQGLLHDRKVDSMLSRLVKCAVVHSWRHMCRDDWSYVLKRVRKWMEGGVLLLEELVEGMADLRKSAGDGVAVKDEAVDALLTQVDTARTVCLDSVLVSVEVCMLLEALPLPGSHEGPQQDAGDSGVDWLSFTSRAQDDIVRMFLTGGLAESALGAVNTTGMSKVASWRTSSRLWDTLAESALKLPDRVVEAGLRAVAMWDVGTGHVAALYRLMLHGVSSHGSCLQQKVACLFLCRPGVLPGAVSEGVTAGGQDGDGVEPNLEQQEVDVSKSPADVACLRPDIVSLLENELEDVESASRTSQQRVRYLLGWAMFLSRFSVQPLSDSTQDRLASYVQDSNGVPPLMRILAHYMPLSPHRGRSPVDASAASVQEAASRGAKDGSALFAVEQLWPVTVASMSVLAGAVFGCLVRSLPCSVRHWFLSLRDRNLQRGVEKFHVTHCANHLLDVEFQKVQISELKYESLTVRVSRNSLEITASYTKDDARLELVLKVPGNYPLREVEIASAKMAGISEARQRKWYLSMSTFLRKGNGGLTEAIALWGRKIENVFEGIEECPICYMVIHGTNGSLPRLPCKTCNYKFHSQCLYTWFATSQKSTCPLCQTPF